MPLLNEVPSCGIVSFLNLEDKTHFTMYSTALPIELGKAIEHLRKGTHQSPELIKAYKDNKLTFKVLETKPDNYSLYTLRAEYSEWLLEFERQGFKDLRPQHKAAQYRIVKKIYEHYDGETDLPLVYIIAISKRNNKLMLGCFNTMMDADNFVQTHFPNLDNAVPVFSDNELSKGYREIHGERMMAVKRRRKRKKSGVVNTLNEVT